MKFQLPNSNDAFNLSKEEACEILRVSSQATKAELKKSFRAQVKKLHPDVSAEGASSYDAFLKLMAARTRLIAKGKAQEEPRLRLAYPAAVLTDQDALSLPRASFSEPQVVKTPSPTLQRFDEQDARLPPGHPTRLARSFLQRRGIVAAFDKSFRLEASPKLTGDENEISHLFSNHELDEDTIVDELLLDCHARGDKLGAGNAHRAIRQILRKDSQKRLVEVLSPLLIAPSAAEIERSNREWLRVARLFDAEEGFVCAVLQHLIWQVKQKVTQSLILHHLMPIVFGREQGSGKTTFVTRFMGPLKELALGPVLLSDYADKRSADLFRYPLLFLDDVGSICPKLVAELKSTFTADYLPRRVLGTGKGRKIRQVTTLIATANSRIHELVVDVTGHRRFTELPFKNGEVAKGGDPAIWPIVDDLDYELLWKSVDRLCPAPILPYVSELGSSSAEQPADQLMEWLLALDFSSEAIQQIRTRDGVRAQGLYELFCVETGAEITQTRFGIELRRLGSDPRLPLGVKLKTPSGFVYPIRRAP